VVRRRDFITLIAGAASSWPLVAHAQQGEKARLIGMLMGFAESDPVAQSMVATFRGTLSKLGWMEGGSCPDWAWEISDLALLRTIVF
jgi:putative ABC transport system substrate-binding protein